MTAIGATSQSPKVRRGTIVAAIVVVCLLGLLIAAPIVVLFSDQQSGIEDGLQQIAIYRAEIARRPALEAALGQARERAARAAGLIEAANASLAQARMQSEIQSIVGANGGSVRSAQVLAATSTRGFELVGIQYDVMVPTSRLRDLIYAIESHTPYFFIDNADIVTLQDALAGDAPGRDPLLEIHWTVHGYRWAGGT